ncbi:hypothetical protein HELRODRAFT_109648, partial [Helobdella robusta]|uniref:Protein kinase domain-containing protein n=1 Tax=Helobdella robusta TaxID=6412 RepID=T1EEV5_HELRO
MENFVLYNEIKKTEHSILYKGRRKGTITYLVIKCVDKCLGVYINNMARLMMSMKHENVVEFKEWYETSKHYWLIMELCTGDSLDMVIEQDKCLPESCVRDFAVNIAEGLHYIHSLGVIYADLQPSKIWLNSLGVLKLADFSLSKMEDESFEQVFNSFSTSGNLSRNTDNVYPDLPNYLSNYGNVKYLAPELLNGHQHSKGSDLWALGCIMYHMFSGHPPFTADTYKQLRKKILEDEMPYPQVSSMSSAAVPYLPPSSDAVDLMRGLLRKDEDA